MEDSNYSNYWFSKSGGIFPIVRVDVARSRWEVGDGPGGATK
jgi:hypothetical protein